jgi:serine phosphatase RsbU (regulator of sigma subunit)
VAGNAACGDLAVVAPTAAGVVVAVMDGLGHGSAAAEAAEAAAGIVRRFPAEPLEELVGRCHRALRATRGVAMSLAFFAAGANTMTWLGVGNVEGVLWRAGRPPARESLLLRGGVVGYRLPSLRSATLAVGPGDILVLATDGITDKFLDHPTIGRDPASLAADILARFRRSGDDALVFVARYLGLPR